MKPSSEKDRVLALRRRLRRILWGNLALFLVLLAAAVVAGGTAPPDAPLKADPLRFSVFMVCLLGTLLDLICTLFVIVHYEDVRKAWNILRARDGVPEAVFGIEEDIRNLQFGRIAAVLFGAVSGGLHVYYFSRPGSTDALDELDTLFLLLGASVAVIVGAVVFVYLTLKIQKLRRDICTHIDQAPPNRRT